MITKLALLTILMSSIITSVGQDIIYKVTGSYKQSKIALSSIIIENVTNGKTMTFSNLPDGDNYLINLSRNYFGGTVGVFDIKRNEHFTIEENLPGLLRLSYFEKEPSINRLSIHNLNGQVLYFSESLMLKPGNSLNIQLPKTGLYIVKIESSNFQQTFKAIGKNGNGDMTITTSSETPDYFYEKDLKVAEIEANEDFSFMVGDSLRIFAYSKQRELFANPEMFQVKDSKDVGFNFQEVIIAQQMELAYPDSTGIIIPFLYEDDTMYCRKINGEYIFQGDILLNREIFEDDSLKGAWAKRHNILNKIEFWPNGIIPYLISKDLKNDERITQAIMYWNTNTPVKYKPKDPYDEEYVEFIVNDNPKAGDSWIGYENTQKGQEIKIGADLDYGSVLHEMGHAAGLIHEHSRSDRDLSVTVHEDCLDSDDVIDYDEYKSSVNVGQFDFNSIMLYDTYYKDPDKLECPKMTRNEGDPIIKVQRSYLSYWDIKALELLYQKVTHKPELSVTSEYHDNSWTITGKVTIAGVGDVTERKIYWKKLGDTDYNYKFFGGGTSDFVLTIENLECGKYFCYATATNEHGESSSEIRSQFILPDVSYSISNITEGSAELKIEVDEDDRTCIYSIYYCLYESKEDAEKYENRLFKSNEIKFIINPLSTQINGLKSNTTYYLRVYLKFGNTDGGYFDNDIIQFSTNSSISVGQNFGGGIIFYVDDTGQHGLIAAKNDQSEGIEWYNGSFKYVGATDKSIGAGQANTSKIITVLGNGNYAASVCDNLVLEGYDDWFLPSQYELDEMTKHFEVLGMQKSAKYWSSTDNGCTSGGIWGGCAYCRDSWGFTSFEGPSSKHSVRAIRKF